MTYSPRRSLRAVNIVKIVRLANVISVTDQYENMEFVVNFQFIKFVQLRILKVLINILREPLFWSDQRKLRLVGWLHWPGGSKTAGSGGNTLPRGSSVTPTSWGEWLPRSNVDGKTSCFVGVMDKMDENEWKYHGEGNKNLVVAHVKVTRRC